MTGIVSAANGLGARDDVVGPNLEGADRLNGTFEVV